MRRDERASPTSRPRTSRTSFAQGLSQQRLLCQMDLIAVAAASGVILARGSRRPHSRLRFREVANGSGGRIEEAPELWRPSLAQRLIESLDATLLPPEFLILCTGRALEPADSLLSSLSSKSSPTRGRQTVSVGAPESSARYTRSSSRKTWPLDVLVVGSMRREDGAELTRDGV